MPVLDWIVLLLARAAQEKIRHFQEKYDWPEPEDEETDETGQGLEEAPGTDPAQNADPGAGG